MNVRSTFARLTLAALLGLTSAVAGPALIDTTIDTVAPTRIAAAIPDVEPDAAAAATVCVSIYSQEIVSLNGRRMGVSYYRWFTAYRGACYGYPDYMSLRYASSSRGHVRANGRCYWPGASVPMDSTYEAIRVFSYRSSCTGSL